MVLKRANNSGRIINFPYGDEDLKLTIVNCEWVSQQALNSITLSVLSLNPENLRIDVARFSETPDSGTYEILNMLLNNLYNVGPSISKEKDAMSRAMLVANKPTFETVLLNICKALGMKIAFCTSGKKHSRQKNSAIQSQILLTLSQLVELHHILSKHIIQMHSRIYYLIW